MVRPEISWLGKLMLVLLRVTIGWHFLYAGLDKLTNPDFTSAAFLGQSKGPFAQKFYDLVPDIDGVERLKGDSIKKEFDAYFDRFTAFYGPATEQKIVLAEKVNLAKEAVDDYLAGEADGIQDYLSDLERLKAAQAAPTHEMPFQQKRNWDKQTQLRGKVKSWLNDLGAITKDYHADLESGLTEAQLKKGSLPEHSAQRFSVDRIVTYTNIAIGVALIIGLFSRLAAFGGAVFLLQIVLAQPAWPGIYPPPHPSAGNALIVNKEFIEMMALFALATLPVGRWAGLDFFIHYLLVKPVYRQEGTQ